MEWGFHPQPKPQHKKVKKNKRQRGEFSNQARNEIRIIFHGQCGHCGNPGQHIHHVVGKGRGGRGVTTNGLLLCFICHERIHKDPGMLNYYIELYTKRHGPDFYKDNEDKGML